MSTTREVLSKLRAVALHVTTLSAAVSALLALPIAHFVGPDLVIGYAIIDTGMVDLDRPQAALPWAACAALLALGGLLQSLSLKVKRRALVWAALASHLGVFVLLFRHLRQLYDLAVATGTTY